MLVLLTKVMMNWWLIRNYSFLTVSLFSYRDFTHTSNNMFSMSLYTQATQHITDAISFASRECIQDVAPIKKTVAV